MLGFCLQGFVSITSIELLPASLRELLSQHDACIVLYYGASKRSSWHSTSLLVANGYSPNCRSECVAVVEVARLNSENVASEKRRNSLKLSGDRLHAVT